MQQISRVIEFLNYHGGPYNRLDRALYTNGNIDSDHTEFSCVSAAKLIIRTLLHVEKADIDSPDIQSLDPRITLLYSDSKFPNLIDFSRDGVYCFDTSTTFEDHCFIVVKYGSAYYYIGGYGGINHYVIWELDYNTLYDQLYESFVKGNYKVYRSLFTDNDYDMNDFFQTNNKKIASARLTTFNMYYISDVSQFNINNFLQHFDMVVGQLTKDSYYPEIFNDISSCASGFCG